jgi:uncharacterized protein YndB with AHSA1/START domain
MGVSTSTITIDAPAERVRAAIAEPAWVQQWQYGSRLLTDRQVGGPISFRTEWKGRVFEQWGTVLEVEPERLVRSELFAPRPGLDDRPEHRFTMSYLLEEAGGGVRLSVVQHDDRPGASPESEESDGGEILAGLKRLAESGAPA